MSRVALLDVNVLLALFDPGHVHQDIAHDWFSDNRELGWATCPVTENGFLRTANAARRGEFLPVPTMVEHLRRFCASGHHQFWQDEVSLADERLFDVSRVRGHRQITDVYLLGLAVKRRGRLITFDQGIQLGAVRGATHASLEILALAE